MRGARALRLLLPKWLLLHLFTIAACVTMVLLGRWQWNVAHRHHGDIRYYAYAFQWWAFVAFALVMWARIVLDYLRTATAEQPRHPVAEPVGGYLAYLPPPNQGPEQDPERVRFNAYLAHLHATDRAKGSE